MRTIMILLAGLFALTSPVAAEPLVVTPRAAGSVSHDEGLAAWSRIEAVALSPRCANCHVGTGGVPMWSGPEYGAARPHGMNIHAGESRMGAETLHCQTCHMTSPAPNLTAHAPPHAGMEWQLAPPAFVWYGQAGRDICAQLRDPARNGGRDGAALVGHITHDAEAGGFIAWGFDPGAGRTPAPGTLQGHLDDMIAWVAAGMPCPGE